MIASFHAAAIRSLDDACLIGAADNSSARAQNFAAQHSIKAYDSYEQMLADEKIDVVCICTPSSFHADNAIAALNAGKFVVLEKPMAITVEDTQRIIEACEKNRRMLTVISQLRFSPDILRVKRLLEENTFGKIVLCDLSMKYWRDPEYFASSPWKGTLKFDGGGALMNQGIHGVDLILYIAGNAKLLYAKKQTVFHNVEVEDVAVATLEFANGALGTIHASTCTYPGFERKIEILGTTGCAIVRENRLEKLVVNGETLVDTAAEIANTANDPSAMDSELHALQIQNLINAIRGKEKLLVDQYEGQKAVKLIEEIYQYQYGKCSKNSQEETLL